MQVGDGALHDGPIAMKRFHQTPGGRSEEEL